MAYINFWQIGIDQINDTVRRLLVAIDQIEPMAAESLAQFEGKNMSDEEQEWLNDYAADEGYMAREAMGAGKQIIPVVIQSYLENWLQTIWKRTRKAKLRRKPRELNTVEHVLQQLGILATDIPKLPGYTDAVECWQVANGVKHGLGKASVNVTLVGGKSIAAGSNIDYSQLRFDEYSNSVVHLLTAVAKYASSTETA